MAFRPLNSSSPASAKLEADRILDEGVVVVQRVQRDPVSGSAYSTWTGMSGRWANRLTSVLDETRTSVDSQLGMVVEGLGVVRAHDRERDLVVRPIDRCAPSNRRCRNGAWPQVALRPDGAPVYPASDIGIDAGRPAVVHR